MVSTQEIIVFIGALLLVIIYVWYTNYKHQKLLETLPIDNKRRPFSMDEKIKVTEKNVLKYGKAKCDNCDNTEQLEIDHINPINLGGHNGMDNLQLLCRTCNAKKGGK